MDQENAESEHGEKRKFSDVASCDGNINSVIDETEKQMIDITKPGEEEPVRIYLFPPKNKQFKVDEATQLISLEPIENFRNENEIEKEMTQLTVTNPVIGSDELDNSTKSSLLTPALESCDITDKSQAILIEACNEIVNETEGTVTENETDALDDSCRLVCTIEKTFEDSRLGRNCFTKGCKWSPDGYCLISCSDDNVLRLFEFSEECLKDFQKGTASEHSKTDPILQMREGGTIYDYAWYPKMNSADPVSCVLASTSQDSPVHLWDAYTGCIRATYQPINQYDEVTPAYSLCFSPDGSKLYCGFKKSLKIFDVSQPGRISEQRSLKVKGEPAYQSNIISSIAVNPAFENLYALGSYDKTIGIYLEPDGELQCLLKGHAGGVTQLFFSPDGLRLYSGGRKDPELLCWDLRNPGQVLFTVHRTIGTNQRIYFDLSKDETYLLTGSTDGIVKCFNSKEKVDNNESLLKPFESWKAHDDCANGVSFHPFHPLIATSSGQRHFILSNDEKDEDEGEVGNIENSVKIWYYPWR